MFQIYITDNIPVSSLNLTKYFIKCYKLRFIKKTGKNILILQIKVLNLQLNLYNAQMTDITVYLDIYPSFNS